MNRRQVIRTVVAATATSASLAAGMTRTEPKSEAPRGSNVPVGLAIVGIGDYARFCLPRIAQSRQVRLTGLVSGDRAKAEAVAAEYGVPSDAIRNYEDFDRIVDDERITAVHVCLPVGLHAEYAERALEAGKHVLCEKPIAHDSKAARRLIDVAARTQRVLMPAYRARYSTGVTEAIKRLPELGRVVAIDAHKGFPMALPAGNWRFDPTLAGGGALFDIGPYSLQLTRWFAGGMPRKVQAFHAPKREDPRFAKVEPHTSWLMEFASGIVATGSASWLYRLQNHATVAGLDAWLRLDPATPAMGERLSIGRDKPSRIEEPQVPLRDQLPVMYDDFAAAIHQKTAPQASATDALQDLLLIEAVTAAALSGRAVTPEGP